MMKKKFLIMLMTMLLLISICAITAHATDAAAPTLKIEGASLSLKNAVYINFKVGAENMTATDSKLLVWDSVPTEYKKDAEAVCLDCLGINSDGYAVFQYDNLTAKDMTKTVYACAYAVVDGVEYYSEPIKYSILTYAHNMKDTADTKLKNLLDGMLDYGALAQIYFNHNTDFLANATIYEINVSNGILEDGFTRGLYQAGATATLTANEAEEGYVFSHWTNSVGETVSETETLEVTVNGAESYVAVYKEGSGEDTYSKGLVYTLRNDKISYSVKKGTCTDINIVIPATHEGLPVTEIATDGFRNLTGVMSVTIPDSVTKLNAYAFSGCTNLISVNIPEGVTSIGKSAFAGCTKLVSINIPKNVTSISNYTFQNCTSLQTVELPDGVTSIGTNAFQNCTALQSIKISDGVTSIPDYAFQNCTTLQIVELPDSVASIGSYAFDGCKGLISISIPDNVTSIGGYAFRNCSNLSNITIPKSLTSLSTSVFEGCVGLTNIVIPDNITSIGNSSFKKCTSLTNITIPQSVTSISYYAFQNCTSLTSIEIPDSVKEIANGVFSGCSNLLTVKLPNALTSISVQLFYKCSNLQTVEIPKTVTSIGNSAFYGCSSDLKVYYAGTAEEWSSITIGSTNNTILTEDSIYYYSETTPTTEGNFWHYVDGVPTAW